MRIRRRSVSSLVSPGPRRPTPPPAPPPRPLPPACRDSASPQPRSRGSRYCSWASSTCALPSLLLACWAKMSRISAVRSMTLTLIRCSRLRSWRRGQLAVADHRVGAGGEHHGAQLVDLAAADVGGRVGPAAPLDQPFEHLRAGGLGERGQLGQRVLRVGRRCPRSRRPTSTTRSSRSWRYSTSVTSVSSVDRPGDPPQRVPLRQLQLAGGDVVELVLDGDMRRPGLASGSPVRSDQ